MKVSVVIPCYNAEPYLGEALRSVLNQTRSPAEVVVVDDGSTDGSRAVAEQFGDRVRVLTERQGGASLARNHGVRHVSGEALMFFDADDVLGPTALEALTAGLATAPDAIAACPWYRLDVVDGQWVRRPASCAPRRPGQDPLSGWLTGWYHPPCSVLWSRAAYEAAGPWDQRGGPNDDGLIMMRALAQGIPLVLTDRGEAFYRRLPAGTPTVSGARFSEEGLRARVFVVEEVARALEQRGRLGPYRSALAQALERIAIDGGEAHPEVSALCQRLAATYAGPRWLRRLRRLPIRLARDVRQRARVAIGAGDPP